MKRKIITIFIILIGILIISFIGIEILSSTKTTNKILENDNKIPILEKFTPKKEEPLKSGSSF
ncbi:hypothetical protein D3C76_576750 [compost metagenome]